MCILKPECQRCETCGLRKYHLWASKEMHDRGCPWGHTQMDACPDAANHAKLIYFCLDNGVQVTDAGRAFVAQMEAAGVDLTAPAEDWLPDTEKAALPKDNLEMSLGISRIECEHGYDVCPICDTDNPTSTTDKAGERG